MILLKDLLFERNPHSDSYTPLTKELEKYIDDPDVYLHFSKIYGKFGVNPQPEDNTPAGLYGYPIKRIYNILINNKYTYAMDRPYAYIFKHKKTGRYIPDIGNLSKSEYDRCMGILLEKLFKNDKTTFDRMILNARANARNKSLGGILFYFVHIISQRNFNDLNSLDYKGNVPRKQTTIWKGLLGITFIADMGYGIIHEAEPTQIVFFDNSYDVLDVVINKEYKNLQLKKGNVSLKDKLKLLHLKEDEIQYNPDGTMDYLTDIYIAGEQIFEFPIKFKTVHGDFTATHCKLSSLKNMPDVINGDFNVQKNVISSLYGCPSEIHGRFDIGNNKLKSLEHGPIVVTGDYDVYHNKLTTLKGCITKINGNFNCAGNELTTLQYGPTIVDGDFNCAINKITSLEYGPKKATKYNCSFNNITVLSNVPKILMTLNISNNKINSVSNKIKCVNLTIDDTQDIEMLGNYIEYDRYLYMKTK